LENLKGKDYFGGGKMILKYDLKENGAFGNFRFHKRHRWMKARGLSSRGIMAFTKKENSTLGPKNR
jgi:hypothetical protein